MDESYIHEVPPPAPEPNVKIEYETRVVPRPISAERYQELTTELRRANILRIANDRNVEKAKVDLKKAKDELEAAELEGWDLVKQLTTGTADTEITVEVHYDYDEKIVAVFDADTGDEYERRPMRPEETQQALDLGDEEESTAEDVPADSGSGPSDPYNPDNSDEWGAFQARFCERCVRDMAFQKGDGEGCEIAKVASVGETPAEWLWDATAGPETALCTAFEPIEEPEVGGEEEEPETESGL